MPERKNLVEVYTNCYGEYGLSAAVDGVVKAGISNLEVAMKTHGGELVVTDDGIVSASMAKEEIERIREHWERKGVKGTSANGPGDMNTEEGVDAAKRCLDVARLIGAKTYVIAGMEYEREEGIRRNFREMADYAEGLGIVIALETHPVLTQNADEILKTMDFFDHKNIRLNYDTGNIYYHNHDPDGEAELRQVAEFVSHVHVKDCRLKYHDWYFPALGDGKIDFKKVFDILNGVGFYGPFSIEIEGIKGEKYDLAARQSMIEKSVNHLRDIGVLD